MKFIDEATIRVEAGAGGSGHISFRREKYIPRGGPDGGDGGDGGSVYLKVELGLTTLADFRMTRRYKAFNGEGGGKRNKTGGGGADIEINVPPGTIVYDVETDELIGEVVDEGERICVAKGGFHGLGNTRFKSSTNRAPYRRSIGSPGEVRELRLELRLLADVGLVGLPNAGKSTFLAAVSRARPKIADYPFTTLHPHLGIVEPDDFGSFTLVDVPGLIEGAAEGAGLGIQFLRHLRRTRLLLHLVSLESAETEVILRDTRTIMDEMTAFDERLASEPRWLVFNKQDLLTPEEAQERAEAVIKALDWQGRWFMVSAKSRQGTDGICREIIDHLASEDLKAAEREEQQRVAGYVATDSLSDSLPDAATDGSLDSEGTQQESE